MNISDQNLKHYFYPLLVAKENDNNYDNYNNYQQ